MPTPTSTPLHFKNVGLHKYEIYLLAFLHDKELSEFYKKLSKELHFHYKGSVVVFLLPSISVL